MKYTVYGKPIGQEIMDIIGSYMDDEIREDLHAELAPCEPEEFLAAYLNRDPDFRDLLEREFEFKEGDPA